VTSSKSAYRCWAASASSVGVILATGLYSRPRILTRGVESTANTAACTRRPSRPNSMARSYSATTLVTSTVRPTPNRSNCRVAVVSSVRWWV
jgi:hypothetical protein